MEEAVKMKRFEYSPLGKELKARDVIAKKQYQWLDGTYEFDKIIKKEILAFKKYHSLILIYNSKYVFYEYYNINFNSLSLTPKYKVLTSFYNELNKFNSLKPQKNHKTKKSDCV